VPWSTLKETLHQTLDEIQRSLFERAKAFRDQYLYPVDDEKIFREKLEQPGGFLQTHWCGDGECERRIQEQTKATIRCIPLDAPQEQGACPFCGKPSTRRVIYAKSY
jgi:prolyl-tRNA synthetase